MGQWENSKIFVVPVTELKKLFTQLKAENALGEYLNFKRGFIYETH